MILGCRDAGVADLATKSNLLILISLQPNGVHFILKLVDLTELMVSDIWIKLVISLTKFANPYIFAT